MGVAEPGSSWVAGYLVSHGQVLCLFRAPQRARSCLFLRLCSYLLEATWPLS